MMEKFWTEASTCLPAEGEYVQVLDDKYRVAITAQYRVAWGFTSVPGKYGLRDVRYWRPLKAEELA